MKKIELSDTVTEEEYSLLIQKLLKAKEELDFVEEESREEKRREDFLTNWNITVNQEDFEKRLKYIFNKGDCVAYITCNNKEGLFYIRIEKK